MSALEAEQVASLAVDHAAKVRLERERCAKSKTTPTGGADADDPSSKVASDVAMPPAPEALDTRAPLTCVEAHPKPTPQATVPPAGEPAAPELARPASDPGMLSGPEADAAAGDDRAIVVLEAQMTSAEKAVGCAVVCGPAHCREWGRPGHNFMSPRLRLGQAPRPSARLP